MIRATKGGPPLDQRRDPHDEVGFGDREGHRAMLRLRGGGEAGAQAALRAGVVDWTGKGPELALHLQPDGRAPVVGGRGLGLGACGQDRQDIVDRIGHIVELGHGGTVPFQTLGSVQPDTSGRCLHTTEGGCDGNPPGGPRARV